MKLNTKTIAVCGLLAAFALTGLSPVFASPASRQNNKNQWRNLATVGAAIAGFGLLEHNQTATLLGAAGAAYSANRYEQDRHSQSQNNDWGGRYHRNYGTGQDYGRNTQGWQNGDWNTDGDRDRSGNYDGRRHNDDRN